MECACGTSYAHMQITISVEYIAKGWILPKFPHPLSCTPEERFLLHAFVAKWNLLQAWMLNVWCCCWSTCDRMLLHAQYWLTIFVLSLTYSLPLQNIYIFCRIRQQLLVQCQSWWGFFLRRGPRNREVRTVWTGSTSLVQAARLPVWAFDYS